MNRSAESSAALEPSAPDQIRNVVILGPPGSGKTVLFERLVAECVPGRRVRETKAETPAGMGVASVAWQGVVINLIDTPGHPDFVGEVRAGLRAADAALFAVSAADGVDEATRLLWRECEVLGMPRAIAITKLEQSRADFDATVEACRKILGDAQPLSIPMMSGGSVTGSLGLLSQRVRDHSGGDDAVERTPEEEEARSLEAARGAFIESVIEESEDDDLLERYLGGEDINLASLRDDLRMAIGTGRFFPVLPTHAPAGVGVHEIFELIEGAFPSPAGRPMPRVFTPAGATVEDVACDPNAPLVAEVIRTTSDPYVGRLSLVRVFSGTVRPDLPVHVSGHLGQFIEHLGEGHVDHDSDDERIGPLSAPIGEDSRPKSAAIAGDIALVAKLTSAETSDTLSSRDRPALVEPWVLPDPLLPVAIHAASKGDEDKLSAALQRLVAEDVTMRLERNAETHQVVIWAMGPAHVDQLIASLQERYHVAVEVEPVRTALRETFVSRAETQGRLVKQSGGHGQYAVCRLQIEPLSRGEGIQFVDKVVGGAVPRQYIPSVEKGVRSQLGKGVLAGYPVVDVRITLVDGKAHSVDSSDMAFQTAAEMALREAANANVVSLLEPIDSVDITVADESVGAVLADLRGRRGQVHGTEPSEIAGMTVIHAEVPERELSRYPIDLRSVSHGTGSFTRSFARYDYLPPALTRDVMAEA
jgi:elongation factor G